MRIGFDAKRAFHNFTGLGNYSRTLIRDLATFYPENEYFLFNTKANKDISFNNRIQEVLPSGFINQKLPALWRSKWMLKDILKHQIKIYHGLSHEIPYGIEKTEVKTIVTIHDLIFELYPDQYKELDVAFYRKKYRFACNHANHIIAISEQTKKDLIDLYHIDAHKISVCYQSCDTSYFNFISDELKNSVREKYHLPAEFVLYVGSIIERKNLLGICKALQQVGFPIPLVVLGNGRGQYRKEIQDFIVKNRLSNQVIFLSEKYGKIPEMAALYALAHLFIYPSIYEGFGIPILEALSVGVPVITSQISCLPEAGGKAAYYVNPFEIDDIASKIEYALSNSEENQQRMADGKVHAATFSNQICTKNVMEVYQKIFN